MFSNISSVSRIARRFVASVPAGGFKVAVLGAAGGIGQPLSMLLKLDHNVQELALFDIVNTPGVEADISHISSNAKTRSFLGPEQLQAALTGMDVVVIPAGVPRKPGMTRDDLFNTNAKIVMTLAQACAKHCPKAHFLVIANPVNSTVPIFGEVLKAAGVYNPRHLFGVTTLDVVRAKTFVAAHQKWDVNQTNVDVIGGHAGTTIIPLLSQVPTKFSESDLDGLVKRIQFGGDEVVNAKNGAGSATLSMAYAGAHFTSRLLKALRGDANIKECAFVESSITAASYFSSPVTLGKDGVDTVHKYGQLSPREQSNLTEMLPQLIAQIEKGIKFAKDNK